MNCGSATQSLAYIFRGEFLKNFKVTQTEGTFIIRTTKEPFHSEKAKILVQQKSSQCNFLRRINNKRRSWSKFVRNKGVILLVLSVFLRFQHAKCKSRVIVDFSSATCILVVVVAFVIVVKVAIDDGVVTDISSNSPPKTRSKLTFDSIVPKILADHVLAH